MKSKPFGALFGLLALVAILGVAPAFGQYDTPDQSTGNVVAGKMMHSAKASDGTTVIVTTSHLINGQPLSLAISFTDANGNKIKHQNYAITVTQDGNSILSNSAGHTHTGDDTQTTSAATSVNPVDIKITLNGVGLPTADPSMWTGVKGEVLSFSQVVPDTTMAPMSNMTSNMTTTSPATTTTPADNATVPEFGPVASIVLAIAVLSMVVFAAKTRVIPRL